MPYGLPSGASLLNAAKSADPEALRARIHENAELHRVRSFCATVRNCQIDSLDALLEHRRDIQQVGKMFMASTILESEQKAANTFNTPGDWFQYLFSRMAEGCQSIDQFLKLNNVTFVTYNFDRLIEAKLIDGVQAQYGDRIKNLTDFFGQIPVIHLHGSLGPLVLRKHRPVLGLNNFNQPLDELDDIEELMTDPLLEAAKSIQIVSEAKPDTEGFIAARKAVDIAAQLFFLGFGFGKDNVHRLLQGLKPAQRQISATRMGMTDAEFRSLAVSPLESNRIGQLQQTNEIWDCLQLLRQCAHLLHD